jgi:molecular chaperone DnaK
LKSAHSSKDLNAIDSAMEKINAAWKVASEEMYKATEEAKNAGGATADSQADNADDVTDVDFEEVDDEKK